MRKISKIILHCTDTPDDQTNWDVKRIREMHIKERRFSDIAYHFLISRPEGGIEPGRPVETVGAHTLGGNEDSIGIAWVGRNVITDLQIKSLKFLLSDLLIMYGLSVFDVYGHHHFCKDRTCPNLNANLIRLLLLSDFDFLSLAKGSKDGSGY